MAEPAPEIKQVDAAAEDTQTNDDAVANTTADATRPAESEADTPKAPSAPSATKPRPLRQIVRGPIEFDRQKPSAVRPSGERPVKQVLNALTGERPKPVPDAGQSDTEPSAAADGAAGGGAGEPTAKPHDADKGETPESKTDDAA